MASQFYQPPNNPERLVSLIINFSVPRSHRFHRGVHEKERQLQRRGGRGGEGEGGRLKSSCAGGGEEGRVGRVKVSVESEDEKVARPRKHA